MDFIVNSDNFKNVAETLYQLINKEIEAVSDIETEYPKLVLMYEFFALLRGSAFTAFREPLGEFQNELYRMEDNIFNKLKELRAQIPENNDRAKFSYDNMVSLALRL